MKRIASLILLSCLFLTGCQEEQLSGTRPKDKASSFEAADTIISPVSGEVKNRERFQQFLTNFKQKETDHIRIIHYTVEGDPIYQELHFDGDIIKTTIDSTEDEYGSGEIWTTMCSEVLEKKTNGEKEYALKGCEDQREHLLFAVTDN